MSDFDITWHKSIRKLSRPPLRKDSNYLLLDDIPINVELFKRLNKILNKALCNNHVCTNICVHLAINKNGISTRYILDFI